MKALEIVRTAALVLMALALVWVAVRGVTFHHDGYVSGHITVESGPLGMDINVR